MTKALPERLARDIERWMSEDPDQKTRDEVGALFAQATTGDPAATAALQEMFSGRLAFGTAGIRGPVRAGPTGMNRVVVSQTTAGLARFLLAKRQPLHPDGFRVVVGCDARVNSEVFLRDTLEVLSGHGIEAIALAQRLPTPLLAFAIRYFDADAAVMVTASHNPPQDNGYKVYLGGADAGSQIVSPQDREIEEHILQVVADGVASIPRSGERISPAPREVVDAYVQRTIDSVSPPGPARHLVRAVYTPLHGVGAETFLGVVSAAGFPAPLVVEEQREPDPAFPTVSFPNPEEPGALDLGIALAVRENADIILANDPDADRLAVALPDPSAGAGYRMLTGNQLGAILGWQVASRARADGKRGALANSLVSSPVLGKIATHFGLDHVETLTGFKYVSRVPDLLFGFEEALGYLVTPAIVRDKDGISAGLAVLALADHLAEHGHTLWDYLLEIEEAVGGFASSQITIRLSGATSKPSLSDLLRASPPVGVGARSVSQIDDFIDGFREFPPENIIRYYLEDGSRVIVRPSGTEPKLKVYLDTQGASRQEAETSLVSLENDVRALLSRMDA